MLNIFKYIDYALKAKQGYNAPEELVSETSFGLIEGFFIISFIILGLITGILGFVAFYYTSTLALVFAILFLLALSIDIFIFIKVKKFFDRMSKKVVDFTKKRYKKFQSDKIIDVEYSEKSHEN